MRCCGSRYQTITVQAGAAAVALLRCASCGNQVWVRDGLVVERDQAFGLLASAYREVPLQARAARDRAACVTAARLAARLAHNAEAAQQAAATQAPATSQVLDLLEGWTVLGATA